MMIAKPRATANRIPFSDIRPRPRTSCFGFDALRHDKITARVIGKSNATNNALRKLNDNNPRIM